MRKFALGMGISLGFAAAACDGNDAPADTVAGETSVETPDTTADSLTPDAVADAAGADDTQVADVSDDTTAPEPLDVWARGPWRVGYRTESITYAPADGSPERTLRVVYWYPTEATEGDEVLYAGLLPAAGVLGDAPIADAAGPLPRLVFSHGNTAFAEQSHFFTAWLASHGWLVAAPDHTGNTFGSRDIPIAIFHWRPLDVTAVLDHLDGLTAPHVLAGRIDTTRTAVAGHSFGGYSALAATGAAWDVDGLFTYCETEEIPLDGCAVLEANEALYRKGFEDPRIDASIPMTPGATFAFGADGAAAVDTPTLMMTGALDRTTTNAADGDPTWQALSASAGDHVRLDFATGGHFTFSDACSLPLGIGDNDGCGEGFIAAEDAHRIINAYALAFLRRHLFGETQWDDLLHGRIAPPSDVELMRVSD